MVHQEPADVKKTFKGQTLCADSEMALNEVL